MTKHQLRPIRVDGDIAYIPLTKGYEAIVDVADLPLVAGWNWYAKVKSNTVYAARNRTVCGRLNALRMHRVILEGDWDEVDHIDGNGLNNRRSNLRPASRIQNCQNRQMRADNQSGIKGVKLHKPSGKWVARISRDGKRIHLGTFGDAQSAAAAYAKASEKWHGPFSRTG